MEKPALTTQPLHPIIQNRWSTRAFQADHIPSAATLHTLLEAAHWAPSCMNEQPWRYLITCKDQHPDNWQSLWSCLTAGNQSWASHAPVLIVACADTVFAASGQPNPWAAYDTGASVQNLALQATALGLSSHCMGGFDSEKLKSTFALPETVNPLAVIAVGYPATDDSHLPESVQEKQRAPRQRKPLTSCCHWGQWQNQD